MSVQDLGASSLRAADLPLKQQLLNLVSPLSLGCGAMLTRLAICLWFSRPNSAVGRILESDIFQQRFFRKRLTRQCFCWIRVFNLHFYFWIPACEGMTAEVSAKLLLPFLDGLCHLPSTSLPISQTWYPALLRPVCRS